MTHGYEHIIYLSETSEGLCPRGRAVSAHPSRQCELACRRARRPAATSHAPRLTLIAEGERYHAETRRILDAIAESKPVLRDEAEPTGLLRVACPTAWAHTLVLPQVPAFLAPYPALRSIRRSVIAPSQSAE